MAHKMPLYVRQHYAIKKTLLRRSWALECDTCGQILSLLKPPKGMPIEENGLRAVIAHTQSHQTPKGQKLYTVAHIGDEVNAQVTPYIHPDRTVDAVYTVPGGHVVHVYAANLTHAKVRSAGISRAHFNAGTPGTGRRHWRFNPR
jgi:hypothetical protein